MTQDASGSQKKTFWVLLQVEESREKLLSQSQSGGNVWGKTHSCFLVSQQAEVSLLIISWTDVLPNRICMVLV